MLRVITVLSIMMLLFSCRWKTDEKPKVEEKKSPVISSLKDASLPCFRCHSYEQFAINESGKFSHQKHLGFGVHCNQCHNIKLHSEMALNKDICNYCHKLTTFTFAGSGMPVTYSHQNHARRYSCSECHPRLFQMKHGMTRITMDDMYKGNSCGKCHNGKSAFSSQECTRCHQMTAFKKDLSYPSGGISPAIFSHQTHTAMFECKNCHTAVFRYKKGGSGMKMDDIYQKKFCGTCHNDEMAFGPMTCNKCHK